MHASLHGFSKGGVGAEQSRAPLGNRASDSTTKFPEHSRAMCLRIVGRDSSNKCYAIYSVVQLSDPSTRYHSLSSNHPLPRKYIRCPHVAQSQHHGLRIVYQRVFWGWMRWHRQV